MSEESAEDDVLDATSKKSMAVFDKALSANTTVWAVSGVAIACTAFYWLPVLWRNKTARRALGAGVSAVVACLAQNLE